MSANGDALSIALMLANKCGFSVFPCHANKAPATPHGFKDASNDADKIRRLWSSYPGPLVGIATGEASGVDVFDVDLYKEAGEAWYAPNCLRFPTTFHYTTERGGLHFYFHHRLGMRSAQNDEYDVRADGGYAVYWATSPCATVSSWHVAEWPEWLLEVVAAQTHRVGADAEPVSQEELKAADPDALAAIVEQLPNSEMFNDRTAWVRLAHAIAGAFPDDPARAEDLWLHHAGKREQKEDEPERVWHTLSGPHKAGAKHIVACAREAGIDVSAYDAAVVALAFKAAGDLPLVIAESQQVVSGSAPRRLWFDDKPWLEAELEERRWIAAGFLLRGAVTLVVGTGGASKSSLMITWSVGLALGRSLHSFRPRSSYRVALYNVEDDATEQRRRLSGALQQFDATAADIDGRISRVGPVEVGTLLRATDGANKRSTYQPTEAMTELEEHISQFRPDVLILDPLVELHEADENDNQALRAVVAFFRSLAIQYNLAIVLIHHTRKGAVIAGDMDSSRGASATVGAARIALTVATMSPQEARDLGVLEEERHRFLRVDGGKANYSSLVATEWFERKPHALANGDTVAALEPWLAPKTSVTEDMRKKVEDGIRKGTPEGPWSPQISDDARSVKWLLNQCGILIRKEQKSLIASLEADGYRTAKFRHPRLRKFVNGLRAPNGDPADAGWAQKATAS